MELEEIFGNLCNRDPRHPMFVELYGEDDCRPVPRAPECSCDNCFYGRDRLALEILRLKELEG